MKNKYQFFCLSVCLLIARNAPGQGTIIAVSSAPDTTSQYSAHLGSGGSPSAVSWISSVAYSGVSVSIPLSGDAGATGFAYLTTSIGPGTTTRNQIAAASFSFPTTASFVPLFSGLSLNAGTYYLVVKGSTTGVYGDGLWVGGPMPTIEAAPGTSANGEFFDIITSQTYTPSSSFDRIPNTYLDYQVTLLPVPEPTLGVPVLIGGIATCIWNRKKRTVNT